MFEMFKKLWREEEGQALSEYGLLIALIALVCIGIITSLGTKLQGKFQSFVNQLG